MITADKFYKCLNDILSRHVTIKKICKKSYPYWFRGQVVSQKRCYLEEIQIITKLLLTTSFSALLTELKYLNIELYNSYTHNYSENNLKFAAT